jgi:N-methylhydantoinase A
VPIPPLATDQVNRLETKFHDKHAEQYGYRLDESVEFLRWRVEATGEIAAGGPYAGSSSAHVSDPPPYSHRKAYFDGEIVNCRAFKSIDLGPGPTLDGPLFVDDPNTTIVVPPGSVLSITPSGHYRIRP